MSGHPPNNSVSVTEDSRRSWCSKLWEATVNEADHRVVDLVYRSATGVTAAKIARAALGDRAKRHSASSLTMIGLAIAARLVGQQVIEPTRTNQFKLNPRKRTP